MTSPPPEGPALKYAVIGDWLVQDANGCNCGAAGDAYTMHEPYCGAEPVARIADLIARAARSQATEDAARVLADLRDVLREAAADAEAAGAREAASTHQWVLDWLDQRTAPDQPAAVSAGTGVPVCGSEFVGVHGDTTACTYPPGHGPIVDTNGHPWDHGIHGTPAVWRKAGHAVPLPAHLVAGDWTPGHDDGEDDPR